ncbi:hypothetical protein GCM10010116_55070 [Microbispora rosea subsp. aerata]|nr:hypothetical protein GCM10010116_55070 [Microbispora rosea subsp. aerata]
MHRKAEKLQRELWAKTPDRAGEDSRPHGDPNLRATSAEARRPCSPPPSTDAAEFPDVDVHQRDGQVTIAATDGPTARAIQISQWRHATLDHDPVQRRRGQHRPDPRGRLGRLRADT